MEFQVEKSKKRLRSPTDVASAAPSPKRPQPLSEVQEDSNESPTDAMMSDVDGGVAPGCNITEAECDVDGITILPEISPHERNSKVKEAICWYSRDIRDSLNFEELIPELLHPKCRFLSHKKLHKLEKLDSDGRRANKLLLILDRKDASASRSFVACLVAEPEHRGHQKTANLILTKLPAWEVQEIMDIVRSSRSRSPSPAPVSGRNSPVVPLGVDGGVSHTPWPSPEKPMPTIELQGVLAGKRFCTLDRCLWTFFSNGEYDKLEVLVSNIRSNVEAPTDWKLVAMWFQSLIFMHKDGRYDKCVSDVLLPALKMCQESESENRNILEGRIHQRMAQIFLVWGLKDLASMHFEKAQFLLQFVGRGYDRVNMYCRQAKIMAATEPHRRQETEQMFNRALENVCESDSFALASLPSIHLSKAAFHLHMSFGSKPDSKKLPPEISTQDMIKARSTLQALPSDRIILSMRKCEYKLLQSELLRLEDRTMEAVDSFEDVIKESETTKLENIAAIAHHRLETIHKDEKLKAIEGECLKGLPEIF